MRKRSSKQGREEINEIAFRVVSEATGEETPREQPSREKNHAAVELGRRGGLKGGKARAQKLTPEQRKQIARKAANSR